MGTQPLQHLGPVEPGVGVSGPGVDGVAPRRQVKLRDRLAEGAVRVPVMRPELDEDCRPGQIDQEHRKGEVLLPRRAPGKPPRRAQAHGVVEGIERSEHVAPADTAVASMRPGRWFAHRTREGHSDRRLSHHGSCCGASLRLGTRRDRRSTSTVRLLCPIYRKA